jgi:oligopeptide transport system substrate-binding protein
MRRTTRARDLTIVGALLVTLLSGCTAPWPFPQPTPDPKLPDAQQVFSPVEGGTYNGDVYSLDPAEYLSGLDYEIAQLLFPPLVTLDDHLQPVDWATERHEVSADGLMYTFHLRKGLQWSDGTPIDANTFAYSINRALDPCLGVYAFYSPLEFPLDSIKGAVAFVRGHCPPGATHSANALLGTSLLVPDPLTLQIMLEAPAGYFLAALTAPSAWAVPERLVERYTQPTVLSDIRGNGVLSTWTYHLTDDGGLGGNLFKFTTWLHPDAARATPIPLPPGTTVDPTVGVMPTFAADGLGHLIFERNPRFWGKRPLLRRIEYTLYVDVNLAWNAYKAGRGDVAYPLAHEVEIARNLKDSTYHEQPELSVRFLMPNWKLAPFDDVRVRQAFWLAIDRQALIQDAAIQVVQPTTHLLMEGLPEYNADLLDPVRRSGAQALNSDLATARTLIASYAADKCSGRLEKCTPINLFSKSYQASPARTRALDTLTQQLQVAFPGWPITVGGCDRGCAPAIVSAQRHQLSDGYWGADYPDGQDALSLPWRTGAIYNQTHVSLPSADALLDQADGAADQGLRTRLYQQAEQLLVNQVAAIPLFQSEIAYMVRTRVANWRIAPTGQTPLSVWQTTYIHR